jgi:oligoribonuclease (3'-5' exoribonuclease)
MHASNYALVKDASNQMDENFQIPQALICWVDCEMDDLKNANGNILEIATILTTQILEEVANCSFVIHVPKEKQKPSEWSKKKLGNLLELAASPQTSHPLHQIEAALIALVDKTAKQLPNFNGRIYLAGSSPHWDWKFIERLMPKFARLLHHQMVDVTFIYLIQKMGWLLNPPFQCPRQKKTHRASGDIRNSLNLAQAFLQYMSSSSSSNGFWLYPISEHKSAF